MIDKDDFCHNIAIETAKMYTNSMLQEKKLSSLEDTAKDLAKNYIQAYIAADEALKISSNRLKAKGLL